MSYASIAVTERFSKRQVVDAGKLLAGRHAEPTEELVAAFQIAHRWRAAHLLPMRAMRDELSRIARKHAPAALTAGRLKRMSSIRRKLRHQRTLYQIQDISGCRVILPTVEHVNTVAAHYLEGRTKHGYVDQDNYIVAPKPDGYRSHHLVYKFMGQPELTAGNRLVVEIQLRSRLQHAWATAVEAVGFVRDENLKAGEGDRDWLRLFELMSGEIASSEGCPVPSTCPERERDRRAELKDLDERLGAIRSLESYNQVLRRAEQLRGFSGYSYLLNYNIATQDVQVIPISPYRKEALAFLSGDEIRGDQNSVLVEVDGIDDLLEAYPNYFLDVREFAKRLKIAVHGTAFVIPQVGSDKAARKRRWGDLSFLERWKR